MTDTSVTITWDAVVVDGGILEYEIFRNDVSVDTRVGTSFVDTGLTPDTEYIYTVSAKSNDGEVSEKSAPHTIRTLTD